MLLVDLTHVMQPNIPSWNGVDVLPWRDFSWYRRGLNPFYGGFHGCV